ncbi:sigma-70 family RNA polymerase sigma factor [Methylobacter sp.]|uniref:RNA polymerase sigma factor n=1 Tax=Methylobacter sp. TaxID=2051955 RepID=UPI002488D55E|nr:sigma-70 family RNA polymerase sigma factor [Methylobacter sp.]MDI1276560.1 sigma-70 family RNA polymerase sigma factor [Methylobacter sp.]MDI1357212.1 sigma-70 family RNA polymerase sigma factor [Methylobacter sp.]
MSNVAAITQLIKSYDQELRRVMFKRCGCIETAADIVQETYQRMMAGNLWQQAENPRALLHRIAANLATDYERRHKVRNHYVDNVDFINDELQSSDGIDPEQTIAGRQRLDKLVEAVNLLPPKCRAVFVLRKFEDLSHAEIAERLDISRNMVEKHLRNAIQKLQQTDDL